MQKGQHKHFITSRTDTSNWIKFQFHKHSFSSTLFKIFPHLGLEDNWECHYCHWVGNGSWATNNGDGCLGAWGCKCTQFSSLLDISGSLWWVALFAPFLLNECNTSLTPVCFTRGGVQDYGSSPWEQPGRTQQPGSIPLTQPGASIHGHQSSSSHSPRHWTPHWGQGWAETGWDSRFWKPLGRIQLQYG